jgi:hypothetical protein
LLAGYDCCGCVGAVLVAVVIILIDGVFVVVVAAVVLVVIPIQVCFSPLSLEFIYTIFKFQLLPR